MPFQSIDPATNETVGNFPCITQPELDSCLSQIEKASVHWGALPIKTRSTYILRIAELLLERKEMLAKLAALEMGKPVSAGIQEVEKCAWVCEHYAKVAEQLLSPKQIHSGSVNSYIQYEPLGTVLAIMPWNFPYWQVFRCAAPNLIAGNTVLLKHAPNVPQCTLAIDEIFTAAKVPEGVFTSIFVEDNDVAALIAHKTISAITFTGSVNTGRKVAETAGRYLKKCVLELGGSDPFVVLDDANLEQAAFHAVKSRMRNCGQSCIAAKRFIVLESVADQFIAYLRKNISALTVGHPEHTNTQIGPLARKDLKITLNKQLKQAKAAGATVEQFTFSAPDTSGNYFAPTLIFNLSLDASVYREELFGPVASVFIVKDEAEAVRVANDTDFGLAGSVWSADIEKAIGIAAQINTGNISINKMVSSHPELPFGGIKNSGYGRELGEHGLKELLNVKTLTIS